jgi:hypothetical protein
MNRLEEIKARAEKATRGPWKAPLKDLGEAEFTERNEFYFDHSFEAYPPLGEAGPVFVAASVEDADFIANARADIPWLIAEIERLHAELDKWESGEYHYSERG